MSNLDFCYKTANIWQIIGYVFLILKIIIPLILIILGIIDVGKAVISSDEKIIKDGVFSLLKRIIAGIIIFFIPTIIRVIFSFVAGFNEEIQEDFGNCFDCLTNPNGECDTSYDDGIFPTSN